MNVKILRQFASEPQVEDLKEWILALRSTGVLLPNQYGVGRYYRPLGEVDWHPPSLVQLKRDLQETFHIRGQCVDLCDAGEVERTQGTPSFIGLQTEGGFVQPHIDGNLGKSLQFRCTLLVSKPESGGKLILADDAYDMEEGDIYCFISNNIRHGTTPVQGDKPRMACSLGFIVDPSFQLGN